MPSIGQNNNRLDMYIMVCVHNLNWKCQALSESGILIVGQLTLFLSLYLIADQIVSIQKELSLIEQQSLSNKQGRLSNAEAISGWTISVATGNTQDEDERKHKPRCNKDLVALSRLHTVLLL